MNSGFSLAGALAVALGAAVGALLRWAAGVALQGSGPGFPWSTLLVNCVGGLAIGALLVVFDRQPNELARLALVTGLLGGLTTFSTFSAESLLLLQRGHWATALGHSAAHLLGSLGCAAAGFALVRWWLGR